MRWYFALFEKDIFRKNRNGNTFFFKLHLKVTRHICQEELAFGDPMYSINQLVKSSSVKSQIINSRVATPTYKGLASLHNM